MPRKQKRYESKIDIESEINSAKRNQIALMVEADSLNAEALSLFKRAASDESKKLGQSQWLRETGLEKKHKAKSKQRRALLIDSKLKKLKDTLAAFETDIMPVIVDSRAVVLQ